MKKGQKIETFRMCSSWKETYKFYSLLAPNLKRRDILSWGLCLVATTRGDKQIQIKNTLRERSYIM